jgi:hypothetical protein
VTDDTNQDPRAEAIQRIQYGDPHDPETIDTFSRAVRMETANATFAQREADELARSQAALKAFREEAGSHLADDRLAEAAAERAAFDVMMEDLAEHRDLQPSGKVRLIVRGEEIEVDADQLVALAQIGSAGESYLNEAKRVLSDAKQEAAALLAQVQGHPQPPLPQAMPAAQTPEDFQALYDEPDLGRQKLAEAVKSQAQAQVQAEREAAELARSKTVLAAFTRDNPQLSSDEAAMAVLERNVFKSFVEDLERVNFDMSQLQNNTEVATLHMKLRAAGHNVRSLDRIFDRAKADYLAWRGDGPRPKQPAPPPENEQPVRRGEPRITVSVNREDRRRNIPTQPPRSAHPLRAPLLEQPIDATSVERRSQVAQNMIEQRRNARNGLRVNSMKVTR